MSRFSPDFPHVPPGFVFEPTKQEIIKFYVRPAIDSGGGVWELGWSVRGKRIRDYDGQLLGHYNYFTYKIDDDVNNGMWDWVMHEYSAKGFNNAAICKIQCKPAKRNNKRNGKTQTKLSVNPRPQKKPRVDDHHDEIEIDLDQDKGSDHDRTTSTCDDDDDDDDDDALFLASLLANPSPDRSVNNVVEEIIQFQPQPPDEASSVGQVADLNPNDQETTFGEIVDWDQLQVIEEVDHKFGSDEYGSLQVWQALIDEPIIPTGFDDMESYGFQSLCSASTSIFPIS
ncbi:No apical meristem (NAM) protein [Corchorus olitorius]|uniref:No apical meristem (NAM) protein n=1 Tax=Corchorus olitorius TaxID=93759 RepID=A0A1R3GNE0_9ROSI|nr:No apical meristem (NAM) protein [Corchorus olitorius]